MSSQQIPLITPELPNHSIIKGEITDEGLVIRWRSIDRRSLWLYLPMAYLPMGYGPKLRGPRAISSREWQVGFSFSVLPFVLFGELLLILCLVGALTNPNFLAPGGAMDPEEFLWFSVGVGCMTTSLIVMIYFVRSGFRNWKPECVVLTMNEFSHNTGDQIGWLRGRHPDDRWKPRERWLNLDQVSFALSKDGKRLIAASDEEDFEIGEFLNPPERIWLHSVLIAWQELNSNNQT